MDRDTAVNRFKRQHTDFTGTFCLSGGYISSLIILKIGVKGIMFFLLQTESQTGKDFLRKRRYVTCAQTAPIGISIRSRPVTNRGIDMNNQSVLSRCWGYSDFRLLWISSLSTYIGRWMETAVGAWLVLQLTDSPFLVGVLGACRFAPMMLGPFCGAISDRYHRRRILLAVQAAYGTASLFVVALFSTALLETWHLFAYVLIGGTCHTLDFSTRYAAAADIVNRKHLVAAISLLVLAMGSTSIFGPLLGGNLLETIKPSGCFIMIFGFFALSFALLYAVKIREPGKSGNRGSMHKDLMDGLRYVKSDPVLFSLVCIAAMVNLFVFPFWFSLLPVFARDILHATAGGYGLLMASIGLGAALGSLLAGSLPESVNKGKLLIGKGLTCQAKLNEYIIDGI